MAGAQSVNLGRPTPSFSPAKAQPVSLGHPAAPAAPPAKATPVKLGQPQKAAPPAKEAPVNLGDHKAAVAKMNPQHVHQLVQDAHAGKYGPQAQQIAQRATAPQGDNNSDGIAGDSTTTPGGKDYSAIFSGGPNPPADGDSGDMTQPVNRASMFGNSQGR